MADSLVIRIGANIRDFEARIKQVENRLKRFSFRAERIGRDLTTRVSLPIVGIGAAAVSTFAKFDRMEKALQAVAGSAKVGSDQFDRLFKIVNDTRTTLDLKGAATAAIQLQAVGQSAAKTENLLKQLGIAATVSGSSADDVGEVGRQLAQAAAKGTILQQELRIVLERIPALAGIISEEFGTVTAEGLNKAGVSADQFLSRLTAAIEGNERFQNVQGGLAKAFESFSANVQKSVADVGKSIAVSLNLEQNLARLSAVIATVADAFTSLDPATQKFIVLSLAATAAVGPLSLGLGAVARSLPLLRSGFGLIAGPLTAAGGAFGTLVTRLSGYTNLIVRGGAVGRSLALARAMTAVRVAMVAITGPIGLIVGGLALLTGAVISAYRNSGFFRQQLDRLVLAFNPIIQSVKLLAEKYFPDLSFSLDGVGSVFEGVFAVIAGGISFIIEGIIKVVDTVKLSAGAIQDFFNLRFSAAADKLSQTLFNPAVIVQTAKDAANAAITTFNQTLEGNNTSKAFGKKVARIVEPAADDTVSGTDAGAGGELASKVPAATAENAKKFSVLAIKYFADAGLEVSRFSARFDAIGDMKVELPKIGGLKGISDADKILQRYNEQLGFITEKQEVFGISFDGASEKINATKAAIIELIEGGYSQQGDALQILTNSLNDQAAAQAENANQAKEAVDQAAKTLALMESAGAKAFSTVSSSMKEGATAAQAFGKAVVSALREAIAAQIQEAVTAQAASALKTVPFPFNVGLAAAAGAGASALFNSLLGALKIPFLAEGGITNGAGLFVAGEAGPEAIIPLSRLNDFMNPAGSNVRVTGEFEILADRLVAMIRQAEPGFNRAF